MKVTYAWLADFVELKLPAQALAEKLTMAGLEVKSVEEKPSDAVFEIEITSNRPDWLSVQGIAREVAAITGRKLKKSPGTQDTKTQGRQGEARNREKLAIVVEEKQDCPLYTAKIIRNVQVTASPPWLRQRLESVGVRSVNNVVDVTNFVLMELGEPLHAFDLDALTSGPVVIRRAKTGEEIVSIDGEVRKLDPAILVIADTRRPVAVAGVMGGKDTEVTEKTRHILLEAAVFNPVVVRRGRQRLGMQSEAAYRFERGVDMEGVEPASARAVELICALCGGEVAAAESTPVTPKRKTPVAFSCESIERHLGVALAPTQASEILHALGFTVKPESKGVFAVTVPSWRQDVKQEIDLVEEIARIYGYEKIPSTLASVALTSREGQTREYGVRIKNILVGQGLCEAVTYSLSDRKSLEGFWHDPDAVLAVQNPLSQEQEVLRPVLMPSLVKTVAFNLQQQPYVAIFEVAKTYRRTAGKIREAYALSFAVCGTRTRWFGPTEKQVNDPAGFLTLKGISEALFECLGIAQKRRYAFCGPDEVEVYLDSQKTGVFKKLSSGDLERFGVKYKDVFAAEFALEETIYPFISESRHFDPAKLPRYPGISRDITLEVVKTVALEEIEAAVLGQQEALLHEARFADYYAGPQVPEGKIRITVSLRYCSAERTLTEEEISPVHERVVAKLKEKFQARVCGY